MRTRVREIAVIASLPHNRKLRVAGACIRHRNDASLRQAVQTDPLEISIVARGPAARSQLECAETQQLLLAALREIPVELQIVIELYYVESLDPAAIATRSASTRTPCAAGSSAAAIRCARSSMSAP